MNAQKRGLVLAGLLVVFGVPLLPLSSWEHEFSGTGHLIGYELIWWVLVAFVFFQTLVVEQAALSSLGFRKLRFVEGIAGIFIGVLTVLGLAFLYFWLLPRLATAEHSQMLQLAETPAWWRVISVIRAAVSEEILFRGYGISRLRAISGSLPLAATLSWAIFTVAHVSTWGWGHLIVAGFGGLMLTLAFLWKENIWVAILAHAVVDGAALLS